MIVKITAPRGSQIQARVTTADGKLDMLVASDLVGRRFADKNETHAFFNATIEESGVLEIGDRVPSEQW